ncbi:hypothetical protein DL96DRAFT_1639665 [Flagelloscypha sp. PMI_526]|nr:hypothetical protein DL96DRAFT_1639665 [Flagelloscypha sp. PMI_526]
MEPQAFSVNSTLKRKYHKKSRAGCLNCKSRRIKCDEDYPICKSCHRRQEACVWSNKSKDPLANFLTPAASSAVSIPHDHQLALPPVGLYRKQELELLHNWSTRTILTIIPDSPQIRHSFQVMLPQLAFDQDFLLHAMFAISSLHMHTFRPSSDDFLRLAKIHCQRAILGLRSAGDTAHQEMAVMANTLLGVYWFASPSWSTAYSNSAFPDIFDWYPATRVFTRGLGTYAISIGNGTTQDSPFMSDDIWNIRKNIMTPPFPNILLNIHRAEACPFDIEELQDSEIVSSYEHSLYKLCQTWNLFMNPMLQNMAFLHFLCNPDELFFQLFMDKHPRALILVAHFCAVIGQFDGTWLYSWERAKSDIQRIIALLDEKWLPWMEFPLNFLAIRNNSAFSTNLLGENDHNPDIFDLAIYPQMNPNSVAPFVSEPPAPHGEAQDFDTALEHTLKNPNALSTFGPPVI